MLSGVFFVSVIGFRRILAGEYKVCDSSIEFDKRQKLILNCTLDIPDSPREAKIEGRVVGVDLGLKVPAYVALNDDKYPRRAIGQIEDFLRVRTLIQKRIRQVYRSLKMTNGGKGRAKKLKALDRFREKERNYVKTYNHFISREIVDFAKKYKAERIHLELLRMAETQEKSILRNWSYYELQQYIEYKAQREGIVVKYVDPYHTSQTCSECGHYEEGQRLSQAQFTCKKCGSQLNADYNAARNIAMSKKWITSKEQSEYYKKGK